MSNPVQNHQPWPVIVNCQRCARVDPRLLRLFAPRDLDRSTKIEEKQRRLINGKRSSAAPQMASFHRRFLRKDASDTYTADPGYPLATDVPVRGLDYDR